MWSKGVPEVSAIPCPDAQDTATGPSAGVSTVKTYWVVEPLTETAGSPPTSRSEASTPVTVSENRTVMFVSVFITLPGAGEMNVSVGAPEPKSPVSSALM